MIIEKKILLAIEMLAILHSCLEFILQARYNYFLLLVTNFR